MTLRTAPAARRTLVERAREGDRSAWKDLRRHYFEPLLRHVRKRTQDPLMTHRVVQETLDEAESRGDEAPGGLQFPLWLRELSDAVMDRAGLTAPEADPE